MRIPISILAAVALLAPPLAACHAEPQKSAATAKALMPIAIRSAGGEHRFRVEVARTPDEQTRGLMFRTSLPKDGGMIFPYAQARPASFWMKNTLIPLDMIFIRTDGTIARIADNTVPESLEPVSSGEPVAAVLEIAGGRSAELGISEGDMVTWAR